MKLHFPVDYFIDMCTNVSTFPINRDVILSSLTYKNYMPTSNFCRYKGLLRRAKFNKITQKAHNKNIAFSLQITPLFLEDMFVANKGVCALSGVPIVLRPRDKTTASLDRINPNIGYMLGNIQWIHRDINLMKNNLQEESFLQVCRLITNVCKKETNF